MAVLEGKVEGATMLGLHWLCHNPIRCKAQLAMPSSPFPLEMAPPKFCVPTAAVALVFLTVASKLLVHGENNCIYREKALVVALLALHSGENCDVVLQRGTQQIAALQLARDAVNVGRQDLPELDIKVYDTCSSSEQAVKATLKALVQAQQGCQGPLFLGLLGPDDAEALRSVAKVISVFRYPHVVSSAVRSFSQYSSTSIEISEPAIKAKAIGMLLNEMNWKSFYLTFTPDAFSTQTAASLLESEELCVAQTVQQVPISRDAAKDASGYSRLLHALQQGQSNRVLLICDDADSAISLLNHLQSVAQKTMFLVSVRGTGLLPWRLSPVLANSTIVIHDTSATGIVPSTFKPYLDSLLIWNEYKNQTICAGNCEDETFVQEQSTATMTAAVHLFKEALRTGQSQKCRPGSGICSQLANLPSDEWRNILEGVSIVVKDEDGIGINKLRFRMLLTNSAKVYAGNITGIFEEVGIMNDGYFSKHVNRNIPVVLHSRMEQCTEDIIPLTTAKPSVVKFVPTPPPTMGIPMNVDIFGIDVNIGNLGFYELIAVLTGLVFGMVLVVVVMICLVYRCFRVQSQNTYSSPSNTSLDLAPKSKKQDRRRFFRSSVRSIHTVQE